MRSVLGIDAAWTLSRPAGVAIVIDDGEGWKVVAAERSYERFQARASGESQARQRPCGSAPDATGLLAAAAALGGAPVDVVAIDMPLSHGPIVGRRTSDNLVSTAFGAYQCGTHSPTKDRPGHLGEDLTNDLARLGYRLQTRSLSPPAAIEVYPHPALVRLAGATRRLSYKLSKAGRYWPDASPPERRDRLLAEWTRITALLQARMGRVAEELRLPSRDARMIEFKAFEDMLDAVICAWVGICALEGRATPYGDDVSSIWIPS